MKEHKFLYTETKHYYECGECGKKFHWEDGSGYDEEGPEYWGECTHCDANLEVDMSDA